MSNSYSYIVEMVDQISGPAKTAQQQIAAMAGKLDTGSEALAKMRAQLSGLEQMEVVDIATRERMVAGIQRQEAALEATGNAVRKAIANEEAKSAAMVKAAAVEEAALAKKLKAEDAAIARDTANKVAGVAKAAKLQAEAQAKEAASAVTAQKKVVADQKKAAGEAEKAQTQSISRAADAMKIGKETITAALTGIGNAFSSLAKGDAKGAVLGVTESIASMAKLLDLAVPGLGQAVAAVISIAGGLVGITVGLIQSGAEFALTSVAAKQAMLGMFDAMGGGIVTGEQTEAMIDNLKAKTGVLKDELVDYTKTLMSMGETDLSKLEGSVLAMASANALMGKEGVGAFTSLKAKIEQATTAGVGLKLADKQMAALYKTGANVDDVAKAMGLTAKELRSQLNAGTADAAKFGAALETALTEKGQGPLDKMTSALPYLKKQFLESMGDIFEDIEVAPFLASVKDLFKIFSQASPAGQTLKAGIGGFFNQVFATATKVVPYVKSFLLDLVIYGLKAYIGLKPIVKAISDFVTSAQGASIISTILTSVWEVLKVIGVTIAVIIAVMVALWVVMIVVSTAFWTAIGAIIGFVSEGGAALTGWIASAATAAYDFVAGLVTGITNGASQVIGAVKGLASSATGAFKSALGIASPSKVMAELGGHTTDGFAMGVEEGTADTQGALESAVAVPKVGGAPGGAAGGGGGGGVVFEAGSIVINAGGANAGELLELLTSMLADKLEELLMQKGGAPA